VRVSSQWMKLIKTKRRCKVNELEVQKVTEMMAKVKEVKEMHDTLSEEGKDYFMSELDKLEPKEVKV